MKISRNARHMGAYCSGLTAIELVIVLAVAAILLATAVPSYTNVIQKSRINSATDLLFVNLNLARGQAVKRRSAVQVCPTSDGVSCKTSDIDWSDGWLVYEPSTNTVLHRVDATSLNLYVNIEADDTINSYVQFNPSGDAFGTDGEFRVCHADPEVLSKSVSVSALGRVESHYREVSGC